MIEEIIPDAKMRSIFFDYNPVGVAIIGTDHKFIDANQAFIDIVGYTLSELRELTWQEITDPQDREMNVAEHNRVIESESLESYTALKNYYAKSNGKVLVKVHGNPVKDAKGDWLYTIGFIEKVAHPGELKVDRLSNGTVVVKPIIPLPVFVKDYWHYTVIVLSIAILLGLEKFKNFLEGALSWVTK